METTSSAELVEQLAHLAVESGSHQVGDWVSRLVWIVVATIVVFVMGKCMIFAFSRFDRDTLPTGFRGRSWTGDGVLTVTAGGQAVLVHAGESFRVLAVRRSGTGFDGDLSCGTHQGRVGSISAKPQSNSLLALYLLFTDGREPAAVVLRVQLAP